MRECQLLVNRSETDAYAAIMDQYLTNIMKSLRQELMTGQGDIKTSISMWRQYHSTLAAIVTKPYLGYIKVFILDDIYIHDNKSSDKCSKGDARTQEQSLDTLWRKKFVFL